MLIAFALRVTVVAAGVNDVHLFPRVQADVVDDEMIVRGILWIDVPTHAVRVSQTQGEHLVLDGRVADGGKRIVVGDAVAAVCAQGARADVLGQCRE